MRKLNWLYLAALVVSVAPACGGGASSNLSCTAPAATAICYEYGSGWTQLTAQVSCASTSGATFSSSSACSSTNRVGRCTTTLAGYTTTTHYYSGGTTTYTSSIVQTSCSNAGGTYVAN